ncbi:FkbM family methyltransferase [Jatrophihabitans sp. DSM 45814]
MNSFPDDDLVGLDDGAVRRVLMTASCSDADELPKVAGAGEVFEVDGARMQRMHNGLVIEEGSYYGPMMTAIIRRLRGHHEPQEEVVIDAIIRRLKGELADRADTDPSAPVSVLEFGSFWSYYSMWFCAAIEQARAVAMEPDPAYLAVGKRHAEANDLADRITFFSGAIGDRPGEELEFVAESDGLSYPVPMYDLQTLMAAAGVSRADVVLVDVQGAESILLERAKPEFAAGAVRFMVVSTHHQVISGQAITHQRALELLIDAGAHVIAEHTVGESYSGDGLIAVSFDPRDADFVVNVSHARYKDSLFGEVEYELETALARADAAENDSQHAHRHIAQLDSRIEQLEAENRALAEQAARGSNSRARQRLGRLMSKRTS